MNQCGRVLSVAVGSHTIDRGPEYPRADPRLPVVPHEKRVKAGRGAYLRYAMHVRAGGALLLGLLGLVVEATEGYRADEAGEAVIVVRGGRGLDEVLA